MTLAAERGVSSTAIGEAVRATTSGDFDAQLPRLNLDDRQIFVRVRMGEKALEHMNSVFDMRLKGRDGLVPLGSIAEIAMGSSPAEIARGSVAIRKIWRTMPI
jgi:multidrug efflux pump subunit AcrB